MSALIQQSEYDILREENNRIIQLGVKQNTPEWLEFRKKRIGASDAPVIMGVSPWETVLGLWENKLGIKEAKFSNFATERGKRLEDQAREELEKMTGHVFFPKLAFSHERPWMMSSLDAIDLEGKYIGEIKCPGREDHAKALAGLVPEKYTPQCQHSIELCELEMLYYFSFDGKKGVIVKVYRDDKYIKKMLKKEEEFFECMQNFIAPEACDKDYETRDDDMFCFSASRLLELQETIKGLEKEEKSIKQDLIRICGNKNTRGAGFRFSKSIRKGSVDYSTIDVLKEINLETYRKPPIETWRLSSER